MCRSVSCKEQLMPRELSLFIVLIGVCYHSGMKMKSCTILIKNLFYKAEYFHSRASAVHCDFRSVQCQSLCWQTPNSSRTRPKEVVWKLYSCNQMQADVSLPVSQPAAPVCMLWDRVWAFKRNSQLRKILRFLMRTEKNSLPNLIVCWTPIWKQRNWELSFSWRRNHMVQQLTSLMLFFTLFYDFTSSLMQKLLL